MVRGARVHNLKNIDFEIEHNTRFLSDLHMPPPPILRTTAAFVLSSAVQRAFTDQELDLDRIRMLLDAARHDGINLDISCLESALRRRLNAAVEQWARKPGDPEALEMVEDLVSLSRVPPLELDLWKPQNVYYQLVEALSGANQTRMSGAWSDHLLGLGKWLGVAVPQQSPELPYSHDGQQRIMEHLADSVFELSDEEILAEVRESGADPEQEAEHTRFVLRQASRVFDSLNKRLSNFGHSINSHSWRRGQGSYHNNCLNCGSSVSFTTTTGEMRGEALDGSCSENEYRSRRAASGK